MFHEKYKGMLELVLRINRETEYAAFFDFQGHVDCITVSIGKGKNEEKEYNNRIYRKTFYARLDAEKTLNNIINELKEFLEVKS